MHIIKYVNMHKNYIKLTIFNKVKRVKECLEDDVDEGRREENLNQ